MEYILTYFNFLLKGIEGRQALYRRDQFPANTPISEIECTQVAESFPKHEYLITDIGNQMQLVTVGNAYRFKVVNDRISNESKRVWCHLKKSSKKTFIISTAAGLTGVGVVLVWLPTLWVAATIMLVALTILGFAIFSYYRFKQADSQLKLWQDPIPNYIEACSEMHSTAIQETARAKEIQELSEGRKKPLKRIIEENLGKIRDSSYLKPLETIPGPLSEERQKELEELKQGAITDKRKNCINAISLQVSILRDHGLGFEEVKEVIQPYLGELPELKDLVK